MGTPSERGDPTASSTPDVNGSALVVDDEVRIQQLLQRAFEIHGWRISSARSAERGLEMFRSERFDLLIIDKNLPGMSGVDMIREVRRIDDAIGIMMITGYGSVEHAVETLNLGVDSFVEKPFDIDRLMATADSIVARARDEARRTHRAATGAIRRQLDEPSKPAGGPARCVEVFVAARTPENIVALTGHLDAYASTVHEYFSSDEVLADAACKPPDIIVVDASFDRRGIVPFVGELRARAPDTACMVVGEGLRLDEVKQLIELEVAAVAGAPDSDVVHEWVEALVAYLRSRPPS